MFEHSFYTVAKPEGLCLDFVERCLPKRRQLGGGTENPPPNLLQLGSRRIWCLPEPSGGNPTGHRVQAANTLVRPLLAAG